jgi:hypothetical protein
VTFFHTILCHPVRHSSRARPAQPPCENTSLHCLTCATLRRAATKYCQPDEKPRWIDGFWSRIDLCVPLRRIVPAISRQRYHQPKWQGSPARRLYLKLAAGLKEWCGRRQVPVFGRQSGCTSLQETCDLQRHHRSGQWIKSPATLRNLDSTLLYSIETSGPSIAILAVR